MPQIKPRIRVLAAGATALVAGAIVVGTSSAQPTRAHAAGTTVHVIEHAITDTENPTSGGKDVKGNILTFNNPVYNLANTRQVGHDEGFCTRLAPKLGMWECLWTTFLRGDRSLSKGRTTTPGTASCRSPVGPAPTVTAAARCRCSLATAARSTTSSSS